jgi:hypothetical protein
MEFNYKRYLASREWGLLKAAVRERCDGQCERCYDGPYQETHHVTYERIGHEQIADLLAVCSPCHRFLSGVSNYDPIPQEPKLRRAWLLRAIEFLRQRLSKYSTGEPPAQLVKKVFAEVARMRQANRDYWPGYEG